MSNLKVTHHNFSNPIIEFDSDTKASGEFHVMTYHKDNDKGKYKDSILLGRCLFKFEKRNDVWKIKHRITVFEYLIGVSIIVKL